MLGAFECTPIEFEVYFPSYYPYVPCEVYLAERSLYSGERASSYTYEVASSVLYGFVLSQCRTCLFRWPEYVSAYESYQRREVSLAG